MLDRVWPKGREVREPNQRMAGVLALIPSLERQDATLVSV
jgi:hypothetical protein